MIKTILWDVDRTLLDFDAAERAAIQSLFVEFGLGECSEEQVARYSVLNMKYWEKLERGEITKPQVLVGRFEEFFAEEGIDVSLAPQFNDAYQLRLGDTIVYRDDSYEIVKSLRGKVRQCVVSNGTVVAQRKKLTRSGLAALQLFPVFHVQDGIARDLLIRAFAKAKLDKKALDGGALGGVKVQQRAVHVPQNRFDHKISPKTVKITLFPRAR